MKRSATSKKGASKKAPAPKAPAKKTAKKAAKKTVKKAVKKAVQKITSVTKSKTKTAAKAVAKKTGSGLVKKVVKGLKAALKKITPAKKAAKAKAPAKAAKPVAKVAPVKAKAPVKVAAKAAPAKTLRPKAFPARDVEKPYGFSADVPELPDSYGEDRLVLLTQDPEYLFTYWEITPEQYALSESAKRTGEEYQEALRLNWIARDLFAPNFALLPVSLDARKGYLRVPYSGLSYQVEIGWVSDQGHFISILGRSNRSDAPESWKQTRSRLKQTAGERSVLEYNLEVTQPLGSSDLGRVGVLSTEARIAGPAGDWNFEGPGSLSSSASSGAAVRKIPAAKKSRP